MKHCWQSADGIVHVMKATNFGWRPICFQPYAPMHADLLDAVPTCLWCMKVWCDAR